MSQNIFDPSSIENDRNPRVWFWGLGIHVFLIATYFIVQFSSGKTKAISKVDPPSFEVVEASHPGVQNPSPEPKNTQSPIPAAPVPQSQEMQAPKQEVPNQQFAPEELSRNIVAKVQTKSLPKSANPPQTNPNSSPPQANFDPSLSLPTLRSSGGSGPQGGASCLSAYKNRMVVLVKNAFNFPNTDDIPPDAMTTIEVHIHKDGSKKTTINKSSGYSSLDRQALMVVSSQVFSPIPPICETDSTSMMINLHPPED